MIARVNLVMGQLFQQGSVVYQTKNNQGYSIHLQLVQHYRMLAWHIHFGSANHLLAALLRLVVSLRRILLAQRQRQNEKFREIYQNRKIVVWIMNVRLELLLRTCLIFFVMFDGNYNFNFSIYVVFWHNGPCIK